jgi:sugar lactone lactonase YvrE
MVWTDSDDTDIYALDFDAERRTISNQRVIFHVLAEGVFPGGLAIDQEDCVWSALWDDGNFCVSHRTVL